MEVAETRPARKRRAKGGSASAKTSSPRLPGMSFLDADAELLKRCKRRFEEELKALREEESQLRAWLRAETSAAPAFDVDAVAEVLDAQGEPTPQLGPTVLPEVFGSPFLSASNSPAGALGAEVGRGDGVRPGGAALDGQRSVLPASCSGWVAMDAAPSCTAVGERVGAGGASGASAILPTAACACGGGGAGSGAAFATVDSRAANTAAATDDAAAAPSTRAGEDDDDDDSDSDDDGGRLAAYAAAAQREALESARIT